jgi:hypothetical protein
MDLKEKIKSIVDQLRLEELKVVEKFMDSLHKRHASKKSKYSDKPPFEEVIKLLGPKGLTTLDINLGRNE